MSNSLQLAIYGKGGIGKSTIAANLAAALAAGGNSVLQLGCDPKHDSTRLLLRGQTPQTVLDYIRDTAPDNYRLEDIILTGEFGVDCAEAGGPEPGIGCAGRGILTTFDLLDRLGIRQRGYDQIIYDVLGDVVCGGFAVPIRNEYSDKVYIITSGEFMSLYAANNILRGLKNYETDQPRVGGIIFNARGGDYELERVQRFAESVKLPIVLQIPRDETFAASERAFRCLVAEYPNSELAQLFYELSSIVLTGSLFSARPLTDEQLEEHILGNSAIQAKPVGAVMTATSQTADSDTNAIYNDVGFADVVFADKTGVSANTSSVGEGAAIQPPAGDVAVGNTDNKLLSKALLYKEPLHGCAFSGALGITIQLGDSISITHGPASCAHIAFQTITSVSRRLLLERGTVMPMQTSPPIVSTDMNESVMIFGGNTQLLQRIEAAKLKQPKAIFVISTCPSGIIGEDLSSLPALSDDITQIIPIATDGNLTGDNLQGVFMGYRSIAEQIIDRSVQPEHGYINIIGEKTIANATAGNLAFANQVFERLGLKLNCRFICETAYDDVKNFQKADLNILAYGDFMGLALQDYLQSQFGARFMSKPFPIGFADSCEWIRDLAAYAGKPEVGEQIIADYQQQYQSELERLRPHLAGKKLMVVTFNHNIDWILSTALDAGMELSFVGILEYSQDHDFRSVFTDQIKELHPHLDYTALMRLDDIQRVSPDVLLGNYLPGGNLGNIVNDTIPLVADVGFFSGIRVAARWVELMRADLGEGWRKDAVLYSQYRAG